MKIAIVCPYSGGWNPSYAHTQVLLSQFRMLAGHELVFIPNDNFDESCIPEGIEVRKAITSYQNKEHYEMNEQDKEMVRKLEKSIGDAVADCDVVFCHDFLVQDWYTIYNLAIQNLKGRWYHWVHSYPSGRLKCPEGHKIVCFTKDYEERLPKTYPDREIVRIPLVRDIRYLMEFDKFSLKLCKDYKLLDSDIICAYPFCTTRYSAKGVDKVLHLLGELQKRGLETKFVGINANGLERREMLEQEKDAAVKYGMKRENICFTSYYGEVFFDTKVVRDMLSISNLFICPSRAESFSLATAEARIMKCLMVLNEIPTLQESGDAMFLDFSLAIDEDYLKWAEEIEKELTRRGTLGLNRNNEDSIYEKYYKTL